MTTLRSVVKKVTLITSGFALFAAGALVPGVRAQGEVLTACVNKSSGEIKMVVGGHGCKNGWVPLEWNQQGAPGPQGPAGPPGPLADITYVRAGMYPGTSVARAFCPPGTRLTGGGGYSPSGMGLKYNFPIGDETGAFASGSQGVGWQVASTDWSDVEAFAVCIHEP